MATTTNYGWTTPDDTALVKDGASAIRTLGTSVDTTTKNLNPSTTLGDIEYRSSTANTNTRLGIGSSGEALTVVAGAPSWAASATSVLTTTGDTLYASGANTLARLGIGTTGQVLTVAAGLPSWATSASGGMTLISTTTLTGASITLSSIPATYNDLRVVVRNYRPATDAVSLRMRFNGDSGATRHRNITAISVFDSGFNDTSVLLTESSDDGASNSSSVTTVYDYANTATFKISQTHAAIVANATTPSRYNYNIYQGYYNQTGAISSLEFFPQSGNFTSGTILLYGVK